MGGPEKPGDSTTKSIWDRGSAAGLVILVLSTVPYLRNLFDWFISDDWVMIEHLRGSTVRQILTGGDLGGTPFWRPLTFLIHIAEVRLFQLNPFGYHVLSILFGAFAGWIFYLFVRKLFGTRTPLFALAAFSFAPTHAANIAWISGRSDVLAAIFLFGALGLHLKWRETRSTAFLALSILCFALGLVSKEVLVLGPLMLLFVDRLVKDKPSLRSTAAVTGIWAAVLVLFLVSRTLILRGLGGYRDIHLQFGAYVFRDLFRYLQLFFVPVGLEESMPWVMNHQALVFAVILPLLCAAILALRRVLTAPAVLLGLAGGAVFLLPVANLFPFPWYVYVPGAWLALAAAGVVETGLSAVSGYKKNLILGAFVLWLAVCGAGEIDATGRWHAAARIAQNTVSSLAQNAYRPNVTNHVFVLTVPQSYRGAFIMGVGLHQALRILRPDIDAIVYPVFLAGTNSIPPIGLHVGVSSRSRITISHSGASAYDYLMPSDYHCGLLPGQSREMDFLKYTVLEQRFRPYLSKVEIDIIPQDVLSPDSTGWIFSGDGLLRVW